MQSPRKSVWSHWHPPGASPVVTVNPPLSLSAAAPQAAVPVEITPLPVEEGRVVVERLSPLVSTHGPEEVGESPVLKASAPLPASPLPVDSPNDPPTPPAPDTGPEARFSSPPTPPPLVVLPTWMVILPAPPEVEEETPPAAASAAAAAASASPVARVREPEEGGSAVIREENEEVVTATSPVPAGPEPEEMVTPPPIPLDPAVGATSPPDSATAPPCVTPLPPDTPG